MVSPASGPAASPPNPHPKTPSNPPPEPAPKSPPIPPTNSGRFHARLVELYKAGAHWDTKVVCGGHLFNATRHVLSLQSEVLDKMLSDAPEGFKKNIIELSVDDPVTVAKMVEFCHCFSYQLVDDGKTAAVHHMRLYFAGGKYKIPELANLALKNFRRECLARWAHPDFIETIRKAYLYSHVPGFSTIQDIILAVAVAAENTFCTKREKHKEFWDLTMEVPTFMRDWMIAQNTAQNITRDPRAPRAQQRYICPACSGVPYLRIYPGETRGHDCRKEIRTKPDYEEPSITEYDAQELFLNENGDMRGGVAQGFEIDEVPNYTPPPTGLPSTPVMASGPHDHLPGKRRSYPIDTPQRSERPAKQQRSG